MRKHCAIVEVTPEIADQLYAGEATLAAGVSVVGTWDDFQRNVVWLKVACRHLPETLGLDAYPKGRLVERAGVLHVEVSLDEGENPPPGVRD